MPIDMKLLLPHFDQCQWNSIGEAKTDRLHYTGRVEVWEVAARIPALGFDRRRHAAPGSADVLSAVLIFTAARDGGRDARVPRITRGARSQTLFLGGGCRGRRCGRRDR